MLKLLTALFILTSSGLYAQNTYNIWYFGSYAGLDFNRSPVKSFVDSGFSTFESSTSICDSSGNILFYTNGNYITNRQGDTMKNGKMKKRHYSASQGSMALKVPGSSNLYLLLLGTESESNYRGQVDSMSYAVIDMNGDNGRGEVIQKETGLLPRALENFAVALHANGHDYWIGAVEKKRSVFNVTQTLNGLSFSGIISYPSETGDSSYSNFSRFSPDSRKMATIYTENTTNTLKKRFVNLYKFDNATGLLSDRITLPIGNVYGMPHLEFSPGSRYLYVRQNVPGKSVCLLQYDLSRWDSVSIVQSNRNLGHSWGSLEGMQIGPDGRLYVFPSGYYNGNHSLLCISRPDSPYPDCIGQDSAIDLGKGSNSLGFPYYPGFAFQRPLIDMQKHAVYCDDDSMTLHADVTDADSFRWRSGTKNNPNLTIHGPGTYYFYSYLRQRLFTDSVIVTFQAKPHFDVITYAELCQLPTTLSFNGTGKPSWSTGETGNTIRRYDTGTVVLTIDNSGCTYQYHIRVAPCDNLECFVPNAFTPNDDYLNDTLMPYCSHINAMKFSVYNPWGELIYCSNDLNARWDGTYRGSPCPAGIYLLTLEISGMSGNKPRTIHIKKTVNLLR